MQSCESLSKGFKLDFATAFQTGSFLIYLYNINGIIISLITVKAQLPFHVESLMFDVGSDKALLKLACIC